MEEMEGRVSWALSVSSGLLRLARVGCLVLVSCAAVGTEERRRSHDPEADAAAEQDADVEWLDYCCTMQLRGFFTDVRTRTRLVASVEPPTSLQLENGKVHPERGDGMEVAKCRDRASGLDQILVRRYTWGSGGGSTAVMYGVQPGGNDIEVVWQTGFYDETTVRHVLIDAEGGCRWREVQRAEQALVRALIGLMEGAEDGIGYEAAVGETAELTARRIDGDKVRDAIGAIHEYSRKLPGEWAAGWAAEKEHDLDPFPGVTTLLAVDVEGARFASDEDAASWLVVRVHRVQACDLPGMVLVQERRSGEWRSIYELPHGSRCEGATVRETMREAYVREGKLYAEVCLTGCEGFNWDDAGWAWFEVDLQRDTATRLRSRPAFVPSVEGPADYAPPLDLVAIASGGLSKRAAPLRD